MAQQVITIGTNPNDDTGELLRAGGSKINNNFTELYALQSSTINAGAVDYNFTGATIPQRIQLAVVDAIVRNADAVFIPAVMLPFDITQISSLAAFHAIRGRLVREGGDFGVYDLLAYGADFLNTVGSESSNDASVAAAIAGASAVGGATVKAPAGTCRRGATVASVPSSVTIRGEGSRATIFLATTANRMFESVGQYTSEGGTRIQDVSFERLKMAANGVGTQGYYAKGCVNVRMQDVYFQSFAQEAVYFDQVWDSYLTQVRFQDHTQAGSPYAQVLLRYGNGDNTDQIHFTECVWETYTRSTVRITSGSGSNEKVNEIFFTGCKYESVYPDVNHIDLGDFRTVEFVNSTFTIARTNSGTPTYAMISNAGRTLSMTNCLVEYFQTGANEYSFFAPTDGDNFKFVNVDFYGTAPQTPINILSGNPYITAVGVSINDDPNADIITGGDPTKLNRIYKNLQVTAKDEEATFTMRRTGAVARSMDWGRIDGNGNVRLIDTTSGDVVIANIFTGNQWQWQRAEAHLPVALTYGTTVSTDAKTGNVFTITVTDGVAFTVANPTNTANGVLLEYQFANTSGGAMGAVSWGTNFRLEGALTNPATGQRRIIVFRREGASLLREIHRSVADQVNT